MRFELFSCLIFSDCSQPSARKGIFFLHMSASLPSNVLPERLPKRARRPLVDPYIRDMSKALFYSSSSSPRLRKHGSDTRSSRDTVQLALYQVSRVPRLECNVRYAYCLCLVYFVTTYTQGVFDNRCLRSLVHPRTVVNPQASRTCIQETPDDDCIVVRASSAN